MYCMSVSSTKVEKKGAEAVTLQYAAANGNYRLLSVMILVLKSKYKLEIND